MKNKNLDSKKDEKNILEKYIDFAFISAIIGVLTVGICPAFGVIGIVIHMVIKSKNAEISDFYKRKSKKALIAGIASLIFFVIDIVILMIVQSK